MTPIVKYPALPLAILAFGSSLSAWAASNDMPGMDHSQMQGMGDMAGMDHSAMRGMDNMLAHPDTEKDLSLIHI